MICAKERLISSPLPDYSLPEIARHLGALDAALYPHFSGKKVILATLALEGYQHSTELVADAIKGTAGEKARAQAAIAYLHFPRENLGLFRAMFHPLLVDEKAFAGLAAAAASSFAIRANLVAQLKLGSAFPADLLLTVLWSALHGAALLESDGWLHERTGLSASDLDATLPQPSARLLSAGLSSGLHDQGITSA